MLVEFGRGSVSVLSRNQMGRYVTSIDPSTASRRETVKTRHFCKFCNPGAGWCPTFYSCKTLCFDVCGALVRFFCVAECSDSASGAIRCSSLVRRLAGDFGGRTARRLGEWFAMPNPPLRKTPEPAIITNVSVALTEATGRERLSAPAGSWLNPWGVEGLLMSDVTIALDNHDEELAILGSRDQFLRQVREALRVKVVARHSEIRIEGEDPDRVEQARRVFDEMRRLYRRQKTLSSGDVAGILDALSGRDLEDAIIAAETGGVGSRSVRPRTDGQARYLRSLRDFELVFAIGPAGTGKTFLAVAHAVAMLRKGQIKKLVLVRPAVEAGEHLGFLPGDLEAKINPYLRPLLDALHDLLPYDQIRRYMGNDLIEIAPLAYMRGRTLNDAYIILDEGQNATVPQMKMFLTRMGQNARIVVTGDTTQVDLPQGVLSGLADAVERLGAVRGIGIVTLDKRDIVRHPLVQAIVEAYEATEMVEGVNGRPLAEPTANGPDRPPPIVSANTAPG